VQRQRGSSRPCWTSRGGNDQPGPETHQGPPLPQRGADREQRRIAADFAENVRLIEASTAVPSELVEQVAELQRLVRDQGAAAPVAPAGASEQRALARGGASDGRRQSCRGTKSPLISNDESALSAATAVPPDLLDLLERVEQQLADQARMLAAQEARIDALEARPADDEDGRARLPGRWRGLKAASKATGYSVSGLRKMCDERRCVFDYSGPHRRINIDTVIRRGSAGKSAKC
jgi:hypothetical protein